MKRHITMTLAALMAVGAAAQDNTKVETTLAADVVSQYIWRGQDLGNASLQPTLGIDIGGLSLTAWGSVGIADANDTKEFDLTLAYTTGGFHVGITDYWFNSGLDPRNRYFKYDAHGTNHLFEANVGYDFGPLALQAYTNIAGNDGQNADGKRAYSTYMEATAPFRLGGCQWEAALGAVPMATSSYGTTGFAIVNIGLKATKSVALTDRFELPLFAAVAANPCSQKAYLVVGFTLQP